MEYLSGLASYMILSRNQMDYNELYDNINKLIEELGDKIQKELVTREQQILLKFKDNLLTAQKQYKTLQRNRNDEVIKEKVLVLKSQQEKIFSLEEEKSLEMNKLYDKLKVDLKRAVEYKHELELQIKFLNRQTVLAQKKSQLLDEQIKEFQDETAIKIESLTSTFNRSFFLPTLKKPMIKKTFSTTKPTLERDARTKCKIESMKEYIDYLSHQETAIQKIFKKYDISAAKSEKQKIQLMETIFNDPTFRKYLYHVLFKVNHAAGKDNKENRGK